MIPRDQELRDEAWHARRKQEIYGPPPRPAGKTISEDGKCLVCRGDLFVMSRHDDRDEASCRFCGTGQPVVKGVL